MTLLILLPTFLFVAVILFLRGGLYRLETNREKRKANPAREPASVDENKFTVVIAARNEERNIAACLQTVLSQDIPPSRYEIIVIDDRSEDATPQILRGLSARYENLRVITIDSAPSGISPKKHAVSMGIESASNGIIVFTDADCRVPPSWLSSIGGYFEDGGTALAQGITSYGYIDGMNKLFFGLQSVDFLSHGIIAAAAIGAGLPINSNANNMAFRRRAFEEAGGYGSDSGVALGDDDHLLQRVWRSGKRVRFMTDPRAAVETAPTETVSALFEQRRRWGSVTVHYGARQVALLSAVFLFYLTIPLTLIASTVNPAMLYVCASLLLVKLAGELVLMIPGTRIFNRKHLRKYIVPASLIQLPMVLAAVVSGVFGRFEWKGRKMARKIGK